VSAPLNRYGNPAKIFDLIGVCVTPIFTDGILLEYRKVLGYPRLKFPIALQAKVLDFLTEFGEVCEGRCSSQGVMDFVDETDRKFYDLAVELDAVVVTGNKRHFPAGAIIMTPRELLERFES